VTPDRWPGGWPLGDAGARERLRSLWQREPCAESGMDAAAMLGALSGLVALADEALAALPSGRAALDALANLRCLVVLGAFATPMSQLAHVVLPIASPVETEGRVLNLEGRVLEWHAALPPPGQARPGWRVLADLGQRLGCPDPYRSLADVRQELRDALAGSSSAVRVAPRDLEPAREGPAEPACVLVRDGVYDWSSDPLVQGSPMLRRDFDSRRKRFPLGLVELCPHDAEGLGLRQGGSVRLRSSQGEAVAPVVLRPELEPGVALVPFAFRDPLAALLGTRGRMEVRLTRA
jgi:NADH-quinone oxidoreductase subunit G